MADPADTEKSKSINKMLQSSRKSSLLDSQTDLVFLSFGKLSL